MKKLIIFLTAATLVSCGGKGGGGGPAPLNSDQKSRLSSTVEAAGRPVGAVKDVKQQHPSGMQMGIESAQPPDQLRIRMAAAITPDACQPAMTGFEALSQPQPMGQMNFNLAMSASGEKCPIDLAFKFDLAASQAGANGKLSYSLTVKDPELAKLNDVTSVQLNGGITGSGSDAKIDMSGVIVSKSLGNLPVVISGTGHGDENSAHSEMMSKIQFADFTAELKVITDQRRGSSANEQYFLNGESISKAEYQSYFVKAFPAVDSAPNLN